MSSNTSLGRGKKGSKYWIQTLINLENGKNLTKSIQEIDSDIVSIEWKSPLSNQNYKELKTNDIDDINKHILEFWPGNGPWWDGVGIATTDKEDVIILVEAKAHTKETKSKCSAKSEVSIDKIKKALEYTHSKLASNEYDEKVWLDEYYQLANRLAFLVYLKEQGVNVKLLLLNIVNDKTHISTSKSDWDRHNQNVFKLMIGDVKIPKDVIILNYDIDNLNNR